jgi:hypothetical protein
MKKMLVIGSLLLTILAGCGGDQNVTVSGGGAQVQPANNSNVTNPCVVQDGRLICPDQG